MNSNFIIKSVSVIVLFLIAMNLENSFLTWVCFSLAFMIIIYPFFIKKGFNKTEIMGGTWLSHIHKWDSNTFTPADDFLTFLDEKTYAWAEITGNPTAGSQFFAINILEIQDKDLSSDLNKRIILQEFFIKLLTPLEVSQELIKSKKILLNSKSVTEFQDNILDHHMKLQKAQRYVYSNNIPQSKPYVSACYKE